MAQIWRAPQENDTCKWVAEPVICPSCGELFYICMSDPDDKDEKVLRELLDITLEHQHLQHRPPEDPHPFNDPVSLPSDPSRWNSGFAERIRMRLAHRGS